MTYPIAFKLDRSNQMSFPKDVAENTRWSQLRLQEMHKRIGAIPTYICYPQFLQELRCGEHICLTEFNVSITANSWYGACANMEGQTAAIASDITGKTPDYGFHLTENRCGKVLIQIGEDLEQEEFGYADYSKLSLNFLP